MIFWILLLFGSTTCHEVTETIEDIEPPEYNITTLYPIENNTRILNKENPNVNQNITKIKSDATTWKVEATFTESKLLNNCNDTESKSVTEKPVNVSKEFKPSPHLGSFFDEDTINLLPIVPTQATYDSFIPALRKPAAGFTSSNTNGLIAKKINKNILSHFPYKIEPSILTRTKNTWRPTLESKPTEEAPVKVPAGGLYKLPDAFKDKPGLSGEDEDFGLDFNGDDKEHLAKKLVNPWKNLLHMMTALIPVGLIISALTPNVITIQSTGPDTYPSNIYRRSGSGIGTMPAISEPCRRRLLCELHSDTNYSLSPYRRNLKRCYKIHCEDPEAMTRMLHWLVTYHRSAADKQRRSLRP